MSLVVAFVVGVVFAWYLYKAAYNYGVKLLGREDKVRQKFVNKLGYQELVAVRDAATAEINRRQGSK